MNRRKAIKLGSMIGALFAFPTIMSNSFLIKNNKKTIRSMKPIKVQLGKIDFYIFSDGEMIINQPEKVFASDISKNEFEKKSSQLHLKKSVAELSINIILIKTSDRTILIDSGLGKHSNDNQGLLLESLINEGIEPNTITDVLITHAHRDHIGGLVFTSNQLVFPEATYHISKEEYDFWMTENPDFSQSKLNQEQITGTVNFIQKLLKIVSPKIKTFKAGETLFNLIKTELAPGHTPGHIVFTIASEDKSIKNVVDILHTPLMISEPDWGVLFDVNFKQGIETRNKILNDCYINNTLVMSSHLPWPGLGYINKRDDEYFWNPISYYNPIEIKL